jgi:hypothetical protein
MKNSIASILICATALTLPFASLAVEKRENNKEEEHVTIAAFSTSLYKIAHSNKVRLLVDANESNHIRVFLKDKSGKTFYSKTINRRDMKCREIFSLVFDMDGMEEGTYFLQVRDKNDNSSVREVSIKNTYTKMISVK